MGTARQNSLVRQHHPGVDVDPNKLRPRRVSDGERRQGVVPQDVHPHRQPGGADHFSGADRQRGERLRRHPFGIERHVAVVLHHHPVQSRFLQSSRIGSGALQDRLQRAAVPWRSRQGEQVDHPDQGALAVKQFGEGGGHGHGSGKLQSSLEVCDEAAHEW